MAPRQASRNVYLDLFKVFLSFLVICIHFVGEAYDHHPLYRLAVPMFFMMSGYFLYYPDRTTWQKRALSFIKRNVHYMLIGFGIYIVYDFIMCYVDGKGVGYYFTTLFYDDIFLQFFILNRPITYSGYQLWFLIALFVVSLIHYLVVRFEKEKWYRVVIPVCIAIYLFFSGYMRLFQYTDMPIRYTRNALFFGLPLFALGFCMAKYDFHKKPWLKYVYLLLGVCFFLLQVIESRIVVMEMYVSTVLSAAFLLQSFVGMRTGRCDWFYRWFGKNMAFYVYILHVAVGITLGRLFEFPNPYLKSTVTLLVSVLIYEICFLVGKGIIQWKHRERV